MSCHQSQRKSQLQTCGSGELNRSHLEHESEMLTETALSVPELHSAETDPHVIKRRPYAVSHSKSRDSGYDEALSLFSLAKETTKKGRDNKQSNKFFTYKNSEQISMGGHQLDAIIPAESGGLEVPKSVASDQKLTGKGAPCKRPESFSDRSGTPDAAYQSLSDNSLNEFLSTEEQLNEATEKTNLDSPFNVKPKTETGTDVESNEREIVTENICDGLLGKRGNSQNKRPPITPRKSIQNKPAKNSTSNLSRLESESHASKPAPDKCATDCAPQTILPSNFEVNPCQVRSHAEINSPTDDPDQKFREHPNQINNDYEITSVGRVAETQTDPSLSYSYNGNAKNEQRLLSEIISRLEDEKKGLGIELKKLQESQEKMSRRIRELEEANREWASYDAQREKYVQNLLRRIVGLEEKCRKDSTENQQLRDEISRLVADNKRLAQTIKELKDSDSSSKLRECEDQLELLQEQVRQCTKDFEAERGDRERAESKVATLEDELRSLRGMNQQSRLTGRGRPSVEVPAFEAQQRIAATDFRREQLSQLVADCQPHGEARTPQTLRSRGCAEEARFFPHFGLPHQQLEVDCHTGNDQFGLSTEPRDQEVWDRGFNRGMDCADGAAGLNDAKLRCPKCWREYPPHRHLELLEHIDICCD
ncbi:myosin-3-like [Lingula anatina]|uniref:Myosin-3-like n=1 Tax=Lingula anatina TaxID=7574 RepID=A0A1S3JQP8_LINAN|nr:myosin-3-like [Lingula anatina]|eukprot:XP_013412299.1 myosin-3-like [Lingula anatina]